MYAIRVTMSADGKGNPPFGRQDSGVYSCEPTPLTPQQPLGQAQPVIGAASVSPLSPIDEAEHHQYPDLDADSLKRSLRQLSREKRKEESDTVSVSKCVHYKPELILLSIHLVMIGR